MSRKSLIQALFSLLIVLLMATGVVAWQAGKMAELYLVLAGLVPSAFGALIMLIQPSKSEPPKN